MGVQIHFEGSPGFEKGNNIFMAFPGRLEAELNANPRLQLHTIEVSNYVVCDRNQASHPMSSKPNGIRTENRASESCLDLLLGKKRSNQETNRVCNGLMVLGEIYAIARIDSAKRL